VINKIEWRVKKQILKEQTEVVESVKSFYIEKLEAFKAINNENLEKIKSVNNIETETLKRALDKLLTLQLQHRNEERQALVNFISSCNQWIFNLSRIKFDEYNIQKIGDLKIKISNIRDEYFLNIYSERLKILLFITNHEVNTSMNLLVDEIEGYKNNMENILIDLLKLLEEQHNSEYETIEVFEDIGEAYVTNYAINNSSKIKTLFLEYKNFNGESFKNCMLQIERFADTAKTYLTSSEFNKP